MRKFLGVLVILLCLVVGLSSIASMHTMLGHRQGGQLCVDGVMILGGPLDGEDDQVSGG